MGLRILDRLIEFAAGESVSESLQKIGMNKSMANILSDGIVASGIVLTTGGPLALPIAVLVFPLGIIEGTIMEASGLNDLIDKHIEQLQNNKINNDGC